MVQSHAVVTTLKRALKSNGLTYADVAAGLKMSEANVKRMFALERFTLERLEEVCRLMQMELSDLFQLYEAGRQRITQLTKEQEKELVADTRLLLVAVCVRNNLEFDEIVSNYQISETECIRYLAKLDRLKVIDLLPHNKFKLRIDENFHWLPNGPIEQFYEKEIQGQFLKANFNHAGDRRLFLSGLLSERSQEIILNRLQVLAKEFTELHRQDRGLPLAKRKNIGFLLALREWDFSVFQPYTRQEDASAS